MNLPFAGLCTLLVAASVGVYHYTQSGDGHFEEPPSVSALPAREPAALPTIEPSAPSGSLTTELQHLQVMEIELAHAKAAVSRSKKKLADLEKNGKADAASLTAKTTREKLQADRTTVERLKIAIKEQERIVASLKAATARQQ